MDFPYSESTGCKYLHECLGDWKLESKSKHLKGLANAANTSAYSFDKLFVVFRYFKIVIYLLFLCHDKSWMIKRLTLNETCLIKN